MTVRLSVQDASVSWTPTDDGQVVVLDIRTSRYLSLNISGSLLWVKLVDGASIEELSSALVAKFDVDQTSADTDVEAFLAALRERDLLVE